MKAITLWQPWASLIADGHKRVETRGWPTNHRGRVAIHASSKPAAEGIDDVEKALLRAWRDDGAYVQDALTRLLQGFVLGCVIATATIEDCIRLEPGSWEPDPLERALGWYKPDRYAWMLTDVTPLDRPIPARGQQGFWEWEESDA